MELAGSTGDISNIAWAKVIDYLQGEDRDRIEQVCKIFCSMSRAFLSNDCAAHRKGKSIYNYLKDFRVLTRLAPENLSTLDEIDLDPEVTEIDLVVGSKRRKFTTIGCSAKTNDEEESFKFSIPRAVVRIGLHTYRGGLPVIVLQSPSGKKRMMGDSSLRRTLDGSRDIQRKLKLFA